MQLLIHACDTCFWRQNAHVGMWQCDAIWRPCPWHRGISGSVLTPRELWQVKLASYEIIHQHEVSMVTSLRPHQDQRPEWGLLKPCVFIYPFRKYLILQRYLLGSLNHFHIWRVSPQLSCSDTWQIWTWYSVCNQCFDDGKKSGK